MAWSPTRTYRRDWKHPDCYWWSWPSSPSVLILSSLSSEEQLIKYRKLKQQGQYFLQETGSQENEYDIKLQTKPAACQEVLMSLHFQDCETWTCLSCNITFLEPISLVSLTVHPEHYIGNIGSSAKKPRERARLATRKSPLQTQTPLSLSCT